MVGGGDGAAEQDRDGACAGAAQQCNDTRDERVVSAAEDAEADGVHVLFNGGFDDGFRGFAQAGVDDLHAGVAEGVDDDARATVVSVEADLGDEDADGARGVLAGGGLGRIGLHTAVNSITAGAGWGSGMVCLQRASLHRRLHGFGDFDA